MVEKAVWEQVCQHNSSIVQSLVDLRLVQDICTVVRADLKMTYRTVYCVPVVISSGHFVLVSGFVQATGIKKSLPELVGDRDMSDMEELTRSNLEEYEGYCCPCIGMSKWIRGQGQKRSRS